MNIIEDIIWYAAAFILGILFIAIFVFVIWANVKIIELLFLVVNKIFLIADKIFL
ncbi:hypothetical protein [Brachyspira hyodysenteriae]|uniref:hypothetical protein n=1 Tax=Brachyspira hyodysenteriae TaxID=159 RepID=UPI000A8B210C|nr:hypothetical protein [Brachyspira hyodysenteriae]